MKSAIQNQFIIKGNAITEGQSDDKRGWFIGAFIASKNLLQRNNDVEIKWGIHPKGDQRFSNASEKGTKSLSILIKGSFRVKFNDHNEILLTQEGDYILWSPNIAHEFQALEDSTVITVR